MIFDVMKNMNDCLTREEVQRILDIFFEQLITEVDDS